MESKNIIISGVGGQGIILASELLALVAMEEGYDVKKSEVHGMSQRGGSVVSHVRIGDKVYSPLIEEGTADAILAFEKAEALRWIHYLHPESGVVIVNDLEIVPTMVAIGLDTYPEDVEGTISSIASKYHIVDGLKYAREAGNERTVNVVLLGVLSTYLPFSEETWLSVIERRVPRAIEENKKAFLLGRGISSK